MIVASDASRLLAAVAVCLGLTAACTSTPEPGLDQDVGASTTVPTTTAPEPTGPGGGEDAPGRGTPSLSDDELVERLAGLGGRLAVGNGPELSVARPDGAAEILLDGSETVVAVQPTWSHDGTVLAWASLSAAGQVVVAQGFGEDGLPAGDPEEAEAAGNPVFYLQWNQADDRLAYLRTSAVGTEVEVGLVEPGAPIEPLATGAPYFIAWSPAPDRLLAHVDDAAIDAFDAGDPDGGFRTIADLGGGFSAPAWVDEGRALVVADGALSLLDVSSGTVEAVEPIGGPMAFVLSPDRRRVAYRRLDGSDDLLLAGTTPAAGDGLHVLDLETGERALVTGDLAAAWEWSPDGSRLAWLSTELGLRPLGRWHFWSVDGSATATDRTPEFIITRKYGQVYLPFFAQYTQSVTGWAPDSTAFAFAGGIDGVRGVWVQLLDEAVRPHRVALGDFVTWGPGEPLPAAGGGVSAA